MGDAFPADTTSRPDDPPTATACRGTSRRHAARRRCCRLGRAPPATPARRHTQCTVPVQLKHERATPSADCTKKNESLLTGPNVVPAACLLRSIVPANSNASLADGAGAPSAMNVNVPQLRLSDIVGGMHELVPGVVDGRRADCVDAELFGTRAAGARSARTGRGRASAWIGRRSPRAAILEQHGVMTAKRARTQLIADAHRLAGVADDRRRRRAVEYGDAVARRRPIARTAVGQGRALAAAHGEHPRDRHRESCRHRPSSSARCARAVGRMHRSGTGSRVSLLVR